RHRSRFSDSQVVVIYPSRRVEQGEVHPYRSLLTGEQVHRVYLDELGDITDSSSWGTSSGDARYSAGVALPSHRISAPSNLREPR
ncbi:MAG: DUF2887 domain-containing protein, partial [Leptolyngbya sp. SIO4C1]|nr:DUF2887 domain-containing protein [Leptolyngbya sp. SIO4C1]